jgi:hypothetical protein
MARPTRGRQQSPLLRKISIRLAVAWIATVERQACRAPITTKAQEYSASRKRRIMANAHIAIPRAILE